MAKKLFDFAIGNPPYQEQNQLSNRQEPVYHEFMEASYQVADCVELITPARFLFNAGQTPKAWNEKMLSDNHFKVLVYQKDASVIFPNTDIKGGVAITVRDSNRDYGKIGVFTSLPMLNNIVRRMDQFHIDKTLKDIVNPKSCFNLDSTLYDEHPELKNVFTKGNEYIIDANIFKKMAVVFDDKKSAQKEIKVYGRIGNTRGSKFIESRFIKDVKGIKQYKVIIPGANNSGHFGETLSHPFVGEPGSIHTQTYMNFGYFNTEYEANACLKYICTRFSRCLLGVLKVTQNNPKAVWAKIPLQDFTPSSDIDWSKSVHEIDLQLYRKYGLSSEEIDFIETNVKEMI